MNQGTCIFLNYNQEFQVRGAEFIFTNFVCVSAFYTQLDSMWYDCGIHMHCKLRICEWNVECKAFLV